MSINRNTILRGPGTVVFGGATLYDASGITCEIESATAGLPSSVSGEIGTIKTDAIGKVTLTPCGQISAGILAALFPYAAATPSHPAGRSRAPSSPPSSPTAQPPSGRARAARPTRPA